MSKHAPSTIGGYVLNAQADIPDARDWPYQPSLTRLAPEKSPPNDLKILDQGQEGACTGFGLAAVINLLKRQSGRTDSVSARMLYEMAKRHDEWPGETYSGSSCRGAVKGWENMGVCSEQSWQYNPDRPGHLSVDAAKQARETTPGAYYRIQHRISDFHAALNEVDAIFVSASVHPGWHRPVNGRIKFSSENQGGHAFAIVGYNEQGFWVQNSWGTSWGENGIALWTYEDWLQNVSDAWVVQLALPTPQIAHLGTSNGSALAHGASHSSKPLRNEVAGHFVHMDDGRFHESGRYWSSLKDLKETASNLESTLATEPNKYQHLLLYAHGGLNSPDDSAKRIAAWKELFKSNGIYPFHFMYDTGVGEELKDVILRRGASSQKRVGAFNFIDKILEWATRPAGRALWREMKAGASTPFKPGRAGDQVLKTLVQTLSGQTSAPLQLHLVGHSTGGILQAHLLERLAKLSKANKFTVASVTLLAPAGSIDLYNTHYAPRLKKQSRMRINQMKVFNLSEQLELDDHVAHVYRKSLLYLVSRAFEESTPEDILGMQKYSKTLSTSKALEFIYSTGGRGGEQRTASTSHGGFDNDLATMNTLLQTIVGEGHQPKHPFEARHLRY